MKRLLSNQQGGLLIEVMVSMFLLVTLTATVGMMVSARQRSLSVARHDAEATALAREPLEQLYALKRNDWANIAPFQGYITIAPSGATYSISEDAGTPPGETLGQFTRTVRLATALRDGSGAISDSGTSPDDNVRIVESVVTWNQQGQARKVELNTYLTNWQEN